MRRLLLATSLFFLLAPPAVAAGRGAVVVTAAGGVDEASAQTARNILGTELRANGVEIVDAPELQGVRRADEGVRSAASRLGVAVVYALQLSPLGEKLYVSVQELDANLAVRAERHLQARDVEELDLVIARLARAIVTGQAVAQTEEIDSVTAGEGRKWEKEPGEAMWGFGLLVSPAGEGPIGGELRFMYEMAHYRLNAHAGWMSGDGDDAVRYCVGASYLFSKGDISPYVGVDVGILDLDVGGREGDGLGFAPHAGLELFRLHGARLILEAGILLPTFEVSSAGRGSAYKAVPFGNVAVLW